jgi:hypothetical protein
MRVTRDIGQEVSLKKYLNHKSLYHTMEFNIVVISFLRVGLTHATISHALLNTHLVAIGRIHYM